MIKYRYTKGQSGKDLVIEIEIKAYDWKVSWKYSLFSMTVIEEGP